jgi:hypothetical protein
MDAGGEPAHATDCRPGVRRDDEGESASSPADDEASLCYGPAVRRNVHPLLQTSLDFYGSD